MIASQSVSYLGRLASRPQRPYSVCFSCFLVDTDVQYALTSDPGSIPLSETLCSVYEPWSAYNGYTKPQKNKYNSDVAVKDQLLNCLKWRYVNSSAYQNFFHVRIKINRICNTLFVSVCVSMYRLTSPFLPECSLSMTLRMFLGVQHSLLKNMFLQLNSILNYILGQIYYGTDYVYF